MMFLVFQSIAQLESQVSSLREEVVHANQLRKQQLVELGLLREEEKQKLQREHETMVRPTAYHTQPISTRFAYVKGDSW